jgi:uncharacterized coiled-coil protein SlyX
MTFNICQEVMDDHCHTLGASIKSGESRIQDKCIRCASKGITHITGFKGSHSIEQIFISSNQIQSLDGIQQFKNLHVLSISFNNISKLSELKLLSGISLQTLNMEGNPIVRLPYYQHYVVSHVPTLKFFDGCPVDDALRSRADSAVAFDIQRLTELCVNEARLSALESPTGDTRQDIELRSILGCTTLESFGMNQSQIDANFDKMRQVAADFRNKQKFPSTMKWADIYSAIESIQKLALDDFQSRIRFPTHPITKTPFRVAVDGHHQTPPTRIEPSPIMRPTRTIVAIRLQGIGDRWAAIQHIQNRRKLHFVIQAWLTLTRQPAHLPQLGRILVQNVARWHKNRCFYTWKYRLMMRPQPCNLDQRQLLEQAQENISRIADLECRLEAQRKANLELRATLAESQKNEGKMKVEMRKMNQRNKSLEKGIQRSEVKYEGEVLQYA